jgi:hypothetical protein
MTAAVDGWLKARLEEGEQPASDIYAAGKEAGFSKDQLKRARARMNGIVRRVGFQPKCYWSLPVPSGHADTPVSQAAPATIKHGSASPPPAVAVPAPSKKQLKLSEMVTETGPPSWHPYHSRE